MHIQKEKKLSVQLGFCAVSIFSSGVGVSAFGSH